ncbi:MAG: DRTGG domain-containing protein [Halanaerobium sp.]|nr:MAG: DRTGG domain-containing protein [Halanaerobium sp.]
MTVREFAEKYKLEVVAGNNLDAEINGVYFGDEPHDVMKMAEEGNIWLTILDGLVTVGVALLADISAVILVEHHFTKKLDKKLATYSFF